MDSFGKDGVVPDVIDAAPTSLLQLTYSFGDVQPGMILTPTQVKDQPAVKWNGDDGAYYTLIMNDPDAPCRENPKFGEWHHWLITNIPGNSVSQGDVMSEYVGAGPPKDTGLHRYVFLLFKQSGGKQTFEGLHKLTNRSGNNRKSWKVRDFAKKYNLQLLAGNFFQAQFDDYVPKLHQQLSGK